MENVYFEYIQCYTKTNFGVITVNQRDCGATGVACANITYTNGTVQFLNYGYNYTSTVYQGPFIWFREPETELVITNVTF